MDKPEATAEPVESGRTTARKGFGGCGGKVRLAFWETLC
jgi:hypothetical protein